MKPPTRWPPWLHRFVPKWAAPLRGWIKPKMIGRDGLALMARWHLLRLGPWALMVHCFLRSDADCCHDHPWAFWSLVLARGYREVRQDGSRIWRSPGSLAFRPAAYVHRVQIERGRYPLTLVLHLRQTREWGFHTLRGWLPWREFDESVDLCHNGEARHVD
jgi:hypothetical protein